MGLGSAAIAALFFSQKSKIDSAINEAVSPTVGAATLLAAMNRIGLTNKYVQAGIMATISKEGGFNPKKSETSYRNTSNARIRMIFGDRNGLHSLSDAQLTALKSDDVKFWNFMYGGPWGAKYLGNTEPGDGNKFVGRGMNGITGRKLYKTIGDIMGVDLISNPDKLNELAIAAVAAAIYFDIGFKEGKRNGYLFKKIGVNDISEIHDTTTGAKAAVQNNYGWKGDLSSTFGQENLKKALAKVNGFYSLINSTT